MNTVLKCLVTAVFAGVVVLCFGHASMSFVGPSEDWPKGIQVDGKKVVVYKPQPENAVGGLLESRAAVSVETNEDEAPVFGAVWFEARLQKATDGKQAIATDIMVTNIRFPGLKEEDAISLRDLLQQNMAKWSMSVDMEALQAALDLERQRDEEALKISTDPPRIIFVSVPAVLVVIDGEPRLKNIENTDLMRVVNTPVTLLFSPVDKKYYLYAAEDTWYATTNMFEDWAVSRQVPAEVAAMAPNEEIPEQDGEPGLQMGRQEVLPEILISTEPAELISSNGEPEYTPIKGTDLLYMTNTTGDVLLNIMDRNFYVLLAGRWYRGKKLEGPWAYVSGEDLPADFRKIPQSSEMARVLYAVPGTLEARNAVLDAHVPTTVAVDPRTATLTVEFDGKPEFKPIRGTSLYYAVNTAIPVIWAGKYYYACDEGVWFVAPSPKGPWRLATSVPESIYLIPPDSPVYHVTYVRVYNTGPDVVYYGYTPGYAQTYVYNGTIVYGTGYYWPGWYGSYYYPRPRTWGVHAHWNPWYGWGYGLSYGTGSFRFSIGLGGSWYRGSWWGPDWYDYPYYYDGYWYGPYYRYGYGRHYPYWQKRNKAREIAIPKRPGTRPVPSKGITRPAPPYYKDKRPKQPYRGYPDGYGGPKEKWLQKNETEPPPRQPGRMAPSPTSQPKQHYDRKWGTQQVNPAPVPPPRDYNNQGRPTRTVPPTTSQPKQQYDRKWGTQQVNPTPVPPPRDYNQGRSPTSQPKQQYDHKWGTQQVDPTPPPQDYNQGRPPPDRVPDFHGTISPRGNSSPPRGSHGGGGDKYR